MSSAVSSFKEAVERVKIVVSEDELAIAGGSESYEDDPVCSY